MTKFNATANVVEVNRYDFVVEAETKEEAEAKLKSFLETNCPYPFQSTPIDGVQCVDREAGMVTRETESIKVD